MPPRVAPDVTEAVGARPRAARPGPAAAPAAEPAEASATVAPVHSPTVRRGSSEAPRPTDRAGARPGGRPSWSGRALGQRTFAPVTVEADVTGFVLALLCWGWVVLPALQAKDAGGTLPAVRNVLRAKFFNKAPDGSWLP